MADYFFATTGDDVTGDGSFGDPWQTPAKAMAEVAAGDTCHFADGTYTITAAIIPSTTGTIGNVITIKATNSGQVTFDLNNANQAFVIDAEDIDYYIWDGLVLEGNEVLDVSRLIELLRCEHWTFIDDELKNSWGHMILAEECHNLTVTDCEIHSEIDFNPGVGHDKTREGIYLYNCDDVVLSGTEIYNVSHTCVLIDGGNRILLDDVYPHDSSSHCVVIGDSSDTVATTDVTIRNSRIDNAGEYRFENDGKRGVFIREKATNVLLFRNRIWDCDGNGIQVERTAIGPVYIYHNTLVNNSKDGIYETGELLFSDSSGISREPVIIAKNNILYHEHTSTFMWFDGDARTNLDIDYNCEYDDDGDITDIFVGGEAIYETFAAYAGGGWEPNSQLNADPLFTNRGAEDFTLQVPASPALNAGVDIGLPFYGAAPDCGYWEFWGDSPPQPPSEGTGVMVG